MSRSIPGCIIAAGRLPSHAELVELEAMTSLSESADAGWLEEHLAPVDPESGELVLDLARLRCEVLA